MSSINLLPKSFNFDDEEKRGGGSKFAILTSLTIMLIPIIFCAVLYFENINSSKEINKLDSEIEIIDEEITERIENNKLLMVENKAADANNLLAKHPYFTKVINLINKSLVTDLYLTSLIIDFNKQEFITVQLETVAKNSSIISSQILIFKNISDVNSVNVDNIVPTEEGYMSFNMGLEIKKQIILYEELSNNEEIN